MQVKFGFTLLAVAIGVQLASLYVMATQSEYGIFGCFAGFMLGIMGALIVHDAS